MTSPFLQRGTGSGFVLKRGALGILVALGLSQVLTLIGVQVAMTLRSLFKTYPYHTSRSADKKQDLIPCSLLIPIPLEKVRNVTHHKAHTGRNLPENKAIE